ncbi:Ig-like domain-containing protein [Candidatus Gracilibacteria bacterium]|nr:Ig-like domain-containing protein [Candidatus Gracilibacteria bacterium]
MSGTSRLSQSTAAKKLKAKAMSVGLAGVMLLLPMMAHAATTADMKALLVLSPDTATVNVGDDLRVQVLLDTKGVEVSQVDFKLKYDPTALRVEDADTSKAGLQIEDGDLFEVLLSNSNQVDTTLGVISYSKIALSESKYYTTGSQPAKLATVEFKALKAGATKVEFQTATTGLTPTKVYRASDEEQVLSNVTNATFTVQASGASVAPTTTTSASPSPTTTTTTSASPSPTATVSASPSPAATTPAVSKPTLAMSLSKTTLLANGTDKATLQVSVKDKDGKAMVNSKVIFGLTGAAMLGSTSAMTNATGIASTTITAGTQAGALRVSANLDSDPTVSASAEMTTTASTVKPSTTPAPTPTTSSTPARTVPAPNQLNQVGPGALLNIFFSAITALLFGGAHKVAKVLVRK